MKRRSVHEHIVLTLEERLRASGRYRRIQSHVIYNEYGFCVELDLEAETHRGDRHYYEVKSRLTEAALAKAEHQAYRVMLALPKRRYKNILVTAHPEKPGELHVQRITPECHHLSGYEQTYIWRHRYLGTCRVCRSDVTIEHLEPRRESL